MNNTDATTTTINGRTYENVKRGHGAAIHLSPRSKITLCSGYKPNVTRVVAKTANCKSCLNSANY